MIPLKWMLIGGAILAAAVAIGVWLMHRRASLKAAKSDYPELFETAVAGHVVRRPEIRDVRVRIFGPLEARLQSIDRVVLGDLNDVATLLSAAGRSPAPRLARAIAQMRRWLGAALTPDAPVYPVL